jgi:hypothetical protein
MRIAECGLKRFYDYGFRICDFGLPVKAQKIPHSAFRIPHSSASGLVFHTGRRRVNLTTVRRILPRARLICGYSRDLAA